MRGVRQMDGVLDLHLTRYRNSLWAYGAEMMRFLVIVFMVYVLTLLVGVVCGRTWRNGKPVWLRIFLDFIKLMAIVLASSVLIDIDTWLSSRSSIRENISPFLGLGLDLVSMILGGVAGFLAYGSIQGKRWRRLLLLIMTTTIICLLALVGSGWSLQGIIRDSDTGFDIFGMIHVLILVSFGAWAGYGLTSRLVRSRSGT